MTSFGMNTPNFFIVGAPKCGTTALYTFLGAHPEIFVSPIKEPQFFAVDTLGDQRRIRTLEDYRTCFEGVRDERRIGEASTAYLSSATAPVGIKAFNPSSRVIILLRDPVEVMYAEHSERLVIGVERFESFEAALDTHEDCTLTPRQGGREKRFPLGYRDIVRFTEQVQRYFDVFGRDNVHVIVYDDLRNDVSRIYTDTLRFLGVRIDFQPTFEVIHANRRVRSKRLQRFLRHPPDFLRKPVHMIFPMAWRKFIGGLLYSMNVVNVPRPPMNPELRRRLKKELELEVVQLGRLLNRDLSAWCET